MDEDKGSAQPSAKKVLGRPKKVQEEEVNQQESDADAMAEDIEPAQASVRKARGRPKKNQSTTEGTITGVQDDDKTAKETNSKKQVVKNSVEALGDRKDMTPAKRGRGRPSKMRRGAFSARTPTPTPDVPDDIEDDSAVAEQINGKSEESEKRSQAKPTNGLQNGPEKGKSEKSEQTHRAKTTNGLQNGQKNAFDEVKADTTEVKAAAENEQNQVAVKVNENNTSIISDSKRATEIPSSILEKDIIYFFFRPRVNVEDPQGIEDVARSYIVLRPLPLGAKLGEGPLEDKGNARLLALPKKMLPKSNKDRFLVFVEK